MYCMERKPLSSVLMDTLEDWLRAFTDDFKRFKRYLEKQQIAKGKERYELRHKWGKVGGGRGEGGD